MYYKTKEITKLQNVTRSHSGFCQFDLMAKYIELDHHSAENVFEAHIHEECEIYVNLSGDVSFVVENRIYPVLPGSIIITRPYEYHHCVYHSDRLHKHFWMLFSCNGNEELFDLFFNRRAGDRNLLVLPPDKTERFFALCHRMTKKEDDKLTALSDFFELMRLLKSADSANPENVYPSDVEFAIKHIGDNFASPVTVSEIAHLAGVSVNTLERHFSETLGKSPSRYLLDKRLSYAAFLLSKGENVTEASEKSGFSDYSRFISVFKKNYGITPLKYKNGAR